MRRFLLPSFAFSPLRVFAMKPVRRGVSLLEVLISMFVISIGLMGVAALIPTGRFSVVEATKADRSANCGRAALSEVKVRNMLDASMYLDPGTGNPVAANFLQLGNAFVIDPLFCAAHATNPAVNRFPYNPGTMAQPPMFRVTLRSSGLPLGQAMSQLVAERIFTWPDDLVWDLDRETPTRRPRQSMLCNDASGSVYPFPAWTGDKAAPPGAALLANADRNYSWLVTVSPSASEIDMTTPSTSKRKFDVSVVVFFKRDMTLDTTAVKPNERWVFGSIQAGGGDVALSTRTDSQPPEYLDVKENQWIMATGPVRDPRLDSPSGPPISRRIAKWYRVIAVDDAPKKPTALWTRRVTLAGPDWSATTNSVQVVLVDNVVGVYTKTIELDLDSIWNQ